MTTQRVTETYDSWSKTYDTHDNPLIPIEELAVRSLLRTLEYETVLDAATGTGRHALFLAEQGKQVTAIDASPGMLAEARKKAAAQRLPVRFEQADLVELPLQDVSCDLVLCALALAHVKDLSNPCQELVRVLRPGGNLVISDLHPWFQAQYGPEYRAELLEGETFFFPCYHSHVDKYLHAVQGAGAQVLAALDIPSRWIPPEGRHVAVPGALIVWAQKPI